MFHIIDDNPTYAHDLHARLLAQDIPKKADVLVSEILGTLLLGESALAFVADCRKRLLTPKATIIPAAGVQVIRCCFCTDWT